jgi:hypothetical protein
MTDRDEQSVIEWLQSVHIVEYALPEELMPCLGACTQINYSGVLSGIRPRCVRPFARDAARRLPGRWG